VSELLVEGLDAAYGASQVLFGVSLSVERGETLALMGRNGAGKSTMLLQAAYNYLERGMLVYLLTAKLDQRAGDAKIASRIGLSMDAQTFEAETNIYDQLSEAYSKDGDDKAPFACVFVDEAQCARGPQSLRSLDRC
jgi:thymidine kinase